MPKHRVTVSRTIKQVAVVEIEAADEDIIDAAICMVLEGEVAGWTGGEYVSCNVEEVEDVT